VRILFPLEGSHPGALRVLAILVAASALSACNSPTQAPTRSDAGDVTSRPRTTARASSPLVAPREESTSAYQVTWSLHTEPTAKGGNDRALVLEYQVKAFEELYLSDLLWDDDPVRHRIPDPFGVYRFVRDGSLWLVFAQALKPPNIRIANPYRPLYSRVLPGETRRRAFRIKLPVDEYSALARDVHGPTVLEEVSRVFFVLGYRLRSTLDRDPEPPLNETAEEAGYVVYDPKLIVLALPIDRLLVKRRTGYIARFALPGEPGSDPMPLPVP
jgi:hypothetical protein